MKPAEPAKPAKSSMLNKFLDIRVFRFLLVGVLNSLFGFTVFGVIAYLGGHTWVALLGGNIAGIVFNFFTIGGIVFRDISRDRFWRFAAAYLGLFFLNLEAIERITQAISIDRILAQALLTAPMALLSYVIMSRLVFRAPTKGTPAI